MILGEHELDDEPSLALNRHHLDKVDLMTQPRFELFVAIKHLGALLVPVLLLEAAKPACDKLGAKVVPEGHEERLAPVQDKSNLLLRVVDFGSSAIAPAILRVEALDQGHV